jgi:hypothetical protein
VSGSEPKETNAGAAKIDGRSGGYMSKWPLISGFVIVLGLGLGACSSSDGLLAQANLAGQANEMCDSGRGAPTGITALNGSQASYAQCMQDHLASGQMGYDEEEGHFAPGSGSTSLFNSGD